MKLKQHRQMIPLLRSAVARAPRSTRSYFSIRAMSKPATAAPATTTTTTSAAADVKKPAVVQPEGAGILIPASKVHQATKAELLGWLEREDGFRKERGGRVPRLVGVLATEKEDARSYAEVSRMSERARTSGATRGARRRRRQESSRRAQGESIRAKREGAAGKESLERSEHQSAAGKDLSSSALRAGEDTVAQCGEHPRKRGRRRTAEIRSSRARASELSLV